MNEKKNKKSCNYPEKFFDSDTVSITEDNNVLNTEDEPQGVKVTIFLQFKAT